MAFTNQAKLAARRRCPKCERGAALGRADYFIDEVLGPVKQQVCRYCGHVTTRMLPYLPEGATCR